MLAVVTSFNIFYFCLTFQISPGCIGLIDSENAFQIGIKK